VGLWFGKINMVKTHGLKEKHATLEQVIYDDIKQISF
jgi:hypothetical protein